MIKKILPLVLIALQSCTSSSYKITPLKEIEEPKAYINTKWQNFLGKAPIQNFDWANINDHEIAFINQEGELYNIDLIKGTLHKQFQTDQKIKKAIALNQKLNFIINDKDELVALDNQGEEVWKRDNKDLKINGFKEFQDILFAQSNNKVNFLNPNTGETLFEFGWNQNTLSFENTLSIKEVGDFVAIGHNGTLSMIDLKQGQVRFNESLGSAAFKGASEIDQLNQVISPPNNNDKTICAAAYQTGSSCFDLKSQKRKWDSDIASKLSLQFSNDLVLILDEKSVIHALDEESGREIWKNEEIMHREVSTFASSKDFVLAFDKEGYLHIFDNQGNYLANLNTKAESAKISNLDFEKNTFLMLSQKDEDSSISLLEVQK